MRAYVVTTAVLFALLTVAHIWRIVVEPHLAGDPWYLLITALSAGLAIWGARLLRVPTRSE